MTQMAHHRQNQFFNVLGLNAGFGQKLRWTEAKLFHFGRCDFPSRVDHQRERAQVRLLPEPVDQGKP
jgi:hypothetical protein